MRMLLILGVVGALLGGLMLAFIMGMRRPANLAARIWRAPAIPGTFVRPGYPGDINDPERFPDE